MGVARTEEIVLLRFILCLVGCLVPLTAMAEASDPKMQMLFIGAAPDAGAPGPLPATLPAIALDTLPAVEDAQQTIFAARLRASPVSTFVSEPGGENAQFEQFFLVTEVALAQGEGYEIALAGQRFGLNEFADRVSALVGAFDPKHRRIGLVRMTDPEDTFPMAIAEVQTALNRIGFDLMVVMIGGDNTGAQCGEVEALHYSLISGLSDRAPFGNGDGVSTAHEVETYLTQALNRQTERDPACGPKYSVLLKTSNDPSQELVLFSGQPPFAEMETRLYNETFEARFLLESDNRDGVQDFLASCLYCPNERALTDRLQQMEDYARNSALEAEIWERIKGDETPARLSIYLENCTLCAYREAVEEKIAVLDAKARARDAEALSYQAAVTARDIAALRSYADTCVDCAFVEEARSIVAEIEADAAYARELAALDLAIEAKDVTLLSAYVEECQICEGKSRATAALERANKRITLLEPCLSSAAVPQLGGPRQLSEIDQATASRYCEAAASEFPEDGEVITTLGRIAQAAGNVDVALGAYLAGIERDIPAAYGLAAYSHYAPPEGTEINLVEAERLAQIGASKGDWLSKEILSVLYSKGLVPGRTPEEAVEIARTIANDGNAMGAFFLGFYYLNGTGVAPDPAQAETWLSKSVAQGHTHAMSFLAELYETADAPQVEKAADLYWAALRSGDATAIDRLTTQLASRNREVIRLIQEKLKNEGAYRGLLDGIPGPGTVAAIQSYANAIVQEG